MSLLEVWVKAAVEHRIIEITYYSSKTKQEITTREVEPDFIGYGRDGKNYGLWATFCHLRNEGPRCFQADMVLKWKATEKSFQPSIYGRWKELMQQYNESNLAEKPY